MYIYTYSLSLSLSRSHIYIHTFSLLAHTRTLTLSLSLTHTHTHTLSLSLSFAPSLARSLSLSLSFSFTLSHTRTQTHTYITCSCTEWAAARHPIITQVRESTELHLTCRSLQRQKFDFTHAITRLKKRKTRVLLLPFRKRGKINWFAIGKGAYVPIEYFLKCNATS